MTATPVGVAARLDMCPKMLPLRDIAILRR